MHLVTFVLFGLSFMIVGDAFKILFFCPVPAHSHQKLYKELWKGLSLKGHQVFAVTPLPDFNQSLTNLTEYDISTLEEFEANQIKPEWKAAFFKKPTFLGAIVRQFLIQKISGDGMEFLYSHPEVQRLVKEHDSFDGCVFEWFHPAIAVYSHLFGCSMIGVGSNSLPIQMLDTVGNPSHPIVAPEQDLPILRNRMTFFQRVWSTFWAVFVRWHQQYFLIPAEDARIRKYYGDDVPYLGDLQRNVSLVIVNRNPAFHRPIPMNPNVIETGYVNYEKPELKVDPDLQKFLNESLEGVVYFSLGISMHGTSMPNQYLEILQDIFKELPYNVVWKWENSTMLNKPPNVFIAKFVPQVYVLEHPNVKLFITQGGLQSTEEAIAAHKPIIGIPFHSDQTTNVDTCVQYGMGKMVDLEDLSELRSYILEVVDDPSYAENAKKLDQLLRDQPQDGVEKAIWWIEYVIRHKGAKHLRSIAVDLPLWQYLLLDVLGFLFVILASFLLIVYYVVKLVFRIVFGRKVGKSKRE